MNIEIKLTTEDIIKAVSGILINGDMGISFKGISTDTRIIRPGYLFWALKGKNFDGHDFFRVSLEKGAKGMVFSYFPRGFKIEEIPKTISIILVKDSLKALGDLANFWKKRINPIIVAITGSCGKTTTKEITYEIVSKFFISAKNWENYNNLIGVPLSILSMKEGTKVGILELGTNQKGEIERLSKIVEPKISVITSIYPSHLEGLDSIKGVLEEKISLFKNTHPKGTLIYNFDQEILKNSVKNFPQNKISFGFSPEADISFQNLSLKNGKIRGSIIFNTKAYDLEINNIGKHNLLNLLAALAVAISLGIDLEKIIPLFEKEISLFQRAKFLNKGPHLIIDDTYNANPGSVKASLEYFKDLASNYQKKIVILGEMKELGKESEKYHKEIGKLVNKIADIALFIGETASYYAEGFKSYDTKNKFYRIFDSVEKFLEIWPVKEFFKKEEKNIILVKGSRALKMERIVEKLVEENS